MTLDEWVELLAYERIRGPLGPPRSDAYSSRQVKATIAPICNEMPDLALPWDIRVPDDQ